ncbi:bifunctional 5,10-methylenetetrahydrofolate dehydrogenase/5,10-methenyltetrahydrofolate cyclohydrolase [uncultured Peptoniphilus sp.]|uniref:bifunctional 5,10-methylenetetrahydrofolate dehydrogenase/5,10-methenyltetrahydrofolate cyclohydrolase n=1 Tax=uncultured Peptoniphilus sp. TaxID=254354 RepID=UPI00258D7DE7|nr:bifunctional 5,10-methylenetetrahydrofolate dehydrogenase/5,10-methenyltetrahydrofolate cyclohydrolase [uncultured Peptoniphilus sp.]MDU6784117.1 bifunctional 5,10-methylenetetrahydrofolate dehydrogenase/5,10-methenyltetrahydrofolate cyclohydrolase [Peptoniphilus harei]
MTKVLYAKDYVDKKNKELIEKVKNLKSKPIISTIRIGDDYGSLAYEKGIKKTAEKIGVQVFSNEFPKDSSEEEVIDRIKKLNEDKKIGGILIFRPLPENFNEEKISLALDPKKDIDCMHPVNMAKVFSGDVSGFTPLAPKASYELLKFYGYDLKGKDTVIINHSNVVGKPLAMFLLKDLATVTICHVGTRDLKKHTKSAEIIFTAMGRAESLDDTYFNESAIVVDIGTSKNKEGKYKGDLDEKSVDGKIKAYSPVPGGIGSITNLLLIENVVNYY